ncbi:hypothetical protein KVH27_35020 [Streptomyces olivaceus]|nr:hypothetical protein [Streptomyces olivaceus]
MTLLRAESGRVDTKAGLLLALAVGLASIGAAAMTQLDLPVAAAITCALGLAAMVVATVLLLRAVEPVLEGSGWPSWHRLTDPELQAQLAQGTALTEVRDLQVATRRKFLRVRLAVRTILAGVGLLALAAALAALL